MNTKKRYQTLSNIAEYKEYICKWIDDRCSKENLSENEVRLLEIVCSRYLEGKSLSLIGKKYGITKERVRQLLLKAFLKAK